MINIEQKPKNCKKNYSKIPFKGPCFELAEIFQTLTCPISKTLKEKNIRPKLKVVVVTQEKKPIEKNFYGSGFKSVTIDYCGVKFKKHKVSNLGIVCGIYGNLNLVVLDFDPKNGFKQVDIEKIIKALGPTYIVKTPSGGIHLYYLSEDLTIKSRPFPGIKGLDIKANGGFVMAAGNEIPAGEYKLDWENDNYLPTVSMLPVNWEKIIERIVLGKETETFSLLSLANTASPVVKTKKENSLKSKKQVNLETVEVLTKTQVFSLVKLLKATKIRVPEGYRNTVACRIAGSLIKKRKGFDFISNELKNIRDISFENPKTFSDEEIEILIRSLISKENKKQNTNLKTNERINGFVFGGEFSENRWINYIFKEVIKESKKTHGIKIKQFKKKKPSKSSSGISLKWCANEFQKLFEELGVSYKKDLALNPVAEVLHEIGIVHTKTMKRNLWQLKLKKLKQVICKVKLRLICLLKRFNNSSCFSIKRVLRNNLCLYQTNDESRNLDSAIIIQVPL